MSWSDRQRIDDWLEEEKQRLYDQHQIWSEVDETRFLAMMDKKPELHYGRDFIEQPLIQPPFIISPFFPAGGLCLMHGKRGAPALPERQNALLSKGKKVASLPPSNRLLLPGR